MKFRPNQIYHVYNQGNNAQNIFFEDKNYLFFLQKIRRYILPLADILCYCLMPNHFHILLIPNTAASDASTAVKPRRKYLELAINSKTQRTNPFTDRQEKLSQAIGLLLSSYTKAINKRYQRSGSLFKAKTKIKDGWLDGIVTLEGPHQHLFFRKENDYALQCFQYIHENPVKAKLVTKATDWVYSSARDYANLRAGTLCNQELARSVLSLKDLEK